MNNEVIFLREELENCMKAIHKAVLVLEDGGKNSVPSALEILCAINDRGSNID